MFNFLYRLKLFQILERFCERYSHLRDYFYVRLNKADDFLGSAPTSHLVFTCFFTMAMIGCYRFFGLHLPYN